MQAPIWSKFATVTIVGETQVGISWRQSAVTSATDQMLAQSGTRVKELLLQYIVITRHLVITLVPKI